MTPRLNSSFRELHNRLVDAGWVYAGIDGGGHHLYRKAGCVPVRLSGSPPRGASRALSNARALVARAIREGAS